MERYFWLILIANSAWNVILSIWLAYLYDKKMKYKKEAEMYSGAWREVEEERIKLSNLFDCLKETKR